VGARFHAGVALRAQVEEYALRARTGRPRKGWRTNLTPGHARNDHAGEGGAEASQSGATPGHDYIRPMRMFMSRLMSQRPPAESATIMISMGMELRIAEARSGNRRREILWVTAIPNT
jgi:hypothetical protein